MAVLSNLFSLAFVYLVLVKFSQCDECVKSGPCSCMFPNGTGYDLSPTKLTSPDSLFYAAKDFRNQKILNSTSIKMSTYYFSPCVDVSMAMRDSCNRPLSLYRDDMEITEAFVEAGNFNATYLCEFLGDIEKLAFIENGTGIVYNNGPSQTTILLLCSHGPTKLQMFSSEEPNNILLAFYSEHACLKQLEEPGRSFGSTLLIIFFSCVIFYLVLGVCTKKFLMGATGLEVIPNLGFWTDLPNLVKDGWAFMISGFKLPPRGVGPAAADPNSYDSI